MSDDAAWPGEAPKERPNKSRLKREARALVALAERLAALDAATLARIEMPAHIRRAFDDLARMHARGARKRQLKFIGKLFRDMDTDAMQDAIRRIDEDKARADARFHRAERWRARLLDANDADALTEFIAEAPGTDIVRLRQLIRNARQERRENKPPRAARELFRLIRDSLPPG